MWISDVHWKLRSTSKKKWTMGRFDDGMPLMGFSGDTGKDNSTQWYSRYCAIDNSSGGLTAADAAESSCRFPSGRTMCFRAPDQKNQASGLPLGRGRQKKSRTVVQNKLDWKFSSAISRLYPIELSTLSDIAGAFHCLPSIWNAIEKSRLFQIVIINILCHNVSLLLDF